MHIYQSELDREFQAMPWGDEPTMFYCQFDPDEVLWKCNNSISGNRRYRPFCSRISMLIYHVGSMLYLTIHWLTCSYWVYARYPLGIGQVRYGLPGGTTVELGHPALQPRRLMWAHVTIMHPTTRRRATWNSQQWRDDAKHHVLWRNIFSVRTYELKECYIGFNNAYEADDLGWWHMMMQMVIVCRDHSVSVE